MLIQILIFILGITVLYAGGMLFIRGSSDIARISHIRPFIIGVFVVAFATSAPEFFVSALAAMKKNQSLAVGNIIGSCICNIGMVLGVSAIIRPIKVEGMMLLREIPMLLIMTLILFIMGIDLSISRGESFFLLICFVAFIIYCIKNAGMVNNDTGGHTACRNSKAPAFILLVSGIAGLLGGAYIVVNSAVVMARYLGISHLIVGLTIVAIGTSLPELCTSAVAAKRGEGDISLGNVIGSNIFNMLAILGAVGILSPIAVDPGILSLNLPVLLLYTIILVPIIKTGYTINRKEGVALLLGYAVYLWVVCTI
jgi:cation:H+ antiporter